MSQHPLDRLFGGIHSATTRIVLWLLSCGASAACAFVWFPLGVLPFVVLVIFSAAVSRERGRPWG